MVEGIYFLKTSLEVLLSVHRHSIWKQFIGLCRSTFSSDFFQKVAETFATRILLISIGLVTSVILARCLGPEGRGLYAVAATIGAIGVQFGNLGLHASHTFYAARDRKLLPALLGNTFVVTFGFGGLIAVVAWIIFSQWPHLAPVQQKLLGLSLAYIPFGLGYMLLQNLLLGIQKIRSYNVVEVINKTLVIILIGFAIIFGVVNVETVFSTTLIASGVCLVLMVWVIRTFLSRFPMPSLEIFKSNIRYGIKVYLTDFFAFAALRMNLLIVQYMLGAEDVGYYSIAVALTDMIYIFPMVVATLLFPRLSAMDNYEKKWKLTLKITYAVAFQMAAVCALIALFAKPLIIVLYGKSFIPSIPLFYLSLISIYFLSIQGVLVKYMASCGYPSTIMWTWFSVLVMSLPLNILFISVRGLPGAMYASIVMNFILMLQIIYSSVRHHQSVELR
jgi:O-antigen/teichoic acid export membrane protein